MDPSPKYSAPAVRGMGKQLGCMLHKINVEGGGGWLTWFKLGTDDTRIGPRYWYEPIPWVHAHLLGRPPSSTHADYCSSSLT